MGFRVIVETGVEGNELVADAVPLYHTTRELLDTGISFEDGFDVLIPSFGDKVASFLPVTEPLEDTLVESA